MNGQQPNSNEAQGTGGAQNAKSEIPAAGSAAAHDGIDAEEADARSQQPQSDNKRTFEWLRNVVFWDVVFTAIVAIFAVVQSIVGYWQWDATNKQYEVMIEQNNIARDQLSQMRDERRAWVNVEARVDEIGADQLKVTYELHNFGGIPAITKRLIVSGFADDAPVDAARWFRRHQEMAAAQSQRYVVPPNASIEIPMRDPISLDPQIAERLKSGKSDFITFVNVEYTDALGPLRDTGRCWVYDFRTKTLLPSSKYNEMK